MGCIVNLEGETKTEREREREREREIPCTPLVLSSLRDPTNFNNSMHISLMGYWTHYNYLNNFHS